MSYDTLLTVYNHDGSIQRREVTSTIYMPLEDAKKDFREAVARETSSEDFNPSYSGQKYRIELVDGNTGEVVDSHDGVVP